jgi:hypothetical protein
METNFAWITVFALVLGGCGSDSGLADSTVDSDAGIGGSNASTATLTTGGRVGTGGQTNAVISTGGLASVGGASTQPASTSATGGLPQTGTGGASATATSALAVRQRREAHPRLADKQQPAALQPQRARSSLQAAPPYKRAPLAPVEFQVLAEPQQAHRAQVEQLAQTQSTVTVPLVGLPQLLPVVRGPLAARQP